MGKKSMVLILRYDHTQHQWFSLTTSNSEMDDCSESLVRIKSLVHKIAAVNINHYVRMSIMISFCPIDFKKHLLIQKWRTVWKSCEIYNFIKKVLGTWKSPQIYFFRARFMNEILKNFQKSKKFHKPLVLNLVSKISIQR